MARLHPGGTAIYGANRGLSPSDIEKYSIAGGTASYLYDSPYHGDYEMCGDLWISEDGLRIFTACGRVFRASDVPAEDMRYGGSLSGATRVRYAVHSAAAGKVLVVAEWKVWLATPYGDYPIVDVGAKGVLTLPAGFDYDFGPVPLFTVQPGTPAGTYGIHCRVLDPVTGKTRHLDENPFLVQ